MARRIKVIKTFEELPAVMNVKDVQEVLGINKIAAYDLVNSGKFPLLKLGKRLLIPKNDFIKWMAENTINGDQNKKEKYVSEEMGV